MAMKWTLRSLLILAVGAAGLAGQTLVKSRPSEATPPSLITSQEKNIRAYIELLRGDTRRDKAQLVGAVMQLDAAESATFWPIYKDFEAEHTQSDDAILTLIKNYAATYATMTNQVADHLATRLLDLEEARDSRKRKYYWKLKDAFGAVTAARLIQIENQLERIIDLQIYSELSAMGSPRGGRP